MNPTDLLDVVLARYEEDDRAERPSRAPGQPGWHRHPSSAGGYGCRRGYHHPLPPARRRGRPAGPDAGQPTVWDALKDSLDGTDRPDYGSLIGVDNATTGQENGR